MIRRSELTLSRLQLALSPALFNWLDEQAEKRGLDLESMTFWSELIDDCCAGYAGAQLRRAFGRHCGS